MTFEPTQPTEEHRWLQQMIGEWTFECDCVMGPDQPPMKMLGMESASAFGEYWTMFNGEGDGMRSHFFLGFDTAKQRFVGSFIASAGTNLWVYEGSLDAARRILTLDTEGPNFADGTLTRYQDIHEIIDRDTRKLSSQYIGADGKWVRFMSAIYRRVS